MDIIKNIFQRKTVDLKKLTAYGFSKESDIYSYNTVLSDSNFIMTVNITEKGEVNAVVIDPAFDDVYTLHLVDGLSGSFAGGIRTEYAKVLNDIADKCFEPDVFKTDLAKEVIAYIKSTYGDEFEYLWQKFPDDAVVRRKDNKKWYATVFTVSRRKLGFNSDDAVEILDLRMKPEEIEKEVDGAKILPGYHMNKKHWITICLDGTVPMEKIRKKIDESYLLAKK